VTIGNRKKIVKNVFDDVLEVILLLKKTNHLIDSLSLNCYIKNFTEFCQRMDLRVKKIFLPLKNEHSKVTTIIK